VLGSPHEESVVVVPAIVYSRSGPMFLMEMFGKGIYFSLSKNKCRL